MHAAVDEEGKARLVIAPCRNRACPTCQMHKSQRLAASIEEAISRIDTPRLLTLTIQSGEKPLREQIDHLWASYRRLRQQRLWRASQRGAIAVMEITLNLQTQQWHPHLHIIIDGDFIQQKQWSAAWEKASEGSPIVDIRLIRSKKQAASYVASYVAKKSTSSRWPAEKIIEHIDALHGRRVNNSCGSLRNIKSEEAAPAPKIDPTQHLIRPSQLARLSEVRPDLTQPIYDRISVLGGWWRLAFGVLNLHPGEATPDAVEHAKTQLPAMMDHARRVWSHWCETGIFIDRIRQREPNQPPDPSLFDT